MTFMATHIDSIETASLLEHESCDDEPTTECSPDTISHVRLSAAETRRAYLCIALLMVLRTLYQFMVELPYVRLYELVICRATDMSALSLQHRLDEAACKVPAIQNRLASVMGLKMTFDALPGRFLE